MANQWFKFYGGEYLSDQKIERLNPTERSCWITLLCLASMNDSGEIKHLTVKSLLNKSGVEFQEHKTELWEESLGILEKLEMLEMITRIDQNTVKITNWEKRQNTAQTGYERLKKHRENKGKLVNDNEMITNDNANDNGRIEENRIEKNRTKNKDVVELEIPEKVNKESWTEWENYRKERRLATYKDTSKKKQWNFLSGYDLETQKMIIDTSIANNWQGLFAPKQKYNSKPVQNVLKSDQTEQILKSTQNKIIQA